MRWMEDDQNRKYLDVSVSGHRCGLAEQSDASSHPKKKAKKNGKKHDDDELFDMAMNLASEEAEVLEVIQPISRECPHQSTEEQAMDLLSLGSEK